MFWGEFVLATDISGQPWTPGKLVDENHHGTLGDLGDDQGILRVFQDEPIS
jgi:hypothetical protein